MSYQQPPDPELRYARRTASRLVPGSGGEAGSALVGR